MVQKRQQTAKVNRKQKKLKTETETPKEGNKLIVVESPAKARTIRQIVGDDFLVESTMGHIMDLPERKFGVDLENGFTPEYVREGEAIAWHVAQVIRRTDAKRIEFHEITKPAVLKALENPREIDTNLVNAQQARRVLDRIFGYTLSPLLWQKIKRNLSAGRVQSVALRLVVEREREIQNFIPKEYWSITATLTPEDRDAPFNARLVQIGERKVTTPEREAKGESENAEKQGEINAANEKDGGKDGGIVISNDVEAKALVDILEQAKYAVLKVERGERKRTPPPPFITSTLQQVASRQLG
ncbi:MAG: DNA topoisomerase, partial [Armatimonadota bacterium]|nr:DNA topoisomerase [Armatimonadota bacterium]